MKLLFLTLIVLASGTGIFAQTETPAVKIDEFYLAKDDGTGNAGDIVESFKTTDVPIHCIVSLDSMQETKVKLVFVAVNVKGVKPEKQIITTSFTTNGEQNQVNFTGRPGNRTWNAGDYRIDIYINDKLATSKSFVIAAATAVPTNAASEFAPKTKPRSRKARKP